MKLYLMRHAEPVDGEPMDSERGLTDQGRYQAGEMAAFLVKQIGRVDIVITSPFVRAVETAEIMGQALGAHLADTKMLEPDGTPVPMWREIERLAQQSEDVLVVGHAPSLTQLISEIVTGESNARLRLDHGQMVHVRTKAGSGMPSGVLHWSATVGMVEREKSPSSEKQGE